MANYILDTNVWLVASRLELFDLECGQACFELLKAIRETGASIILDSPETNPPGNSVLQEFKQNVTEGEFAYDLFWRHIVPSGLLEYIPLTYDSAGAVLPGGIQINQLEPNGKSQPFEPSDRKWIALQLLHPQKPVIHNAVDGDWEKARADLTTHRIQVKQLGGVDIP